MNNLEKEILLANIAKGERNGRVLMELFSEMTGEAHLVLEATNSKFIKKIGVEKAEEEHISRMSRFLVIKGKFQVECNEQDIPCPRFQVGDLIGKL